MATIDEILASMPDVAAEAAYEPLTIDPVTRQVIIPEAEEIFGVEGDGRAARKYFICPRYVGDNLDLATCFLEVVYRNANGEVDRYLVEDLAATEDMVAFSWELTGKVTAYKGAIQFKVHADNGAGRDWGTTLATGTSLEGLEPEAVDVETETSDLVTQLRAMVTAQTGAVEVTGAAQVEAVETAGAATTADAKAQIEAKGEAVRASIPADYATLAGTVDRLTHDRAAAIVCEAAGTSIQIPDASADPLHGLRIFGRSTQAGDPTPDNPVDIVSLPAPVVTVCGKNLLNLPQTIEKPTSGYNYDLFAGTAGQATAVPAETLAVLPRVEAGRSYYFSFKLPAEAIAEVKVIAVNDDGTVGDAGGATAAILAVNAGAFTPVKSSYVTIRVGNADATTIHNLQLELGDVATDYEPYTGQTLTIITPDSLPGIPVASGGNYTDAAGQQWIADEVDLARGVYVQRVGRLTLDGSAKWNAYNYETVYYGFHIWDLLDEYHSRAVGLCNQFEIVGSSSGDCVWVGASNANVYVISKEWYDKGLDAWKEHLNAKPLEIVYARMTPAETPLTTEELQAFRALRTNKPTATVLNDAGAWMAVEYAADPKLYIDNKLAALIANN